LDNDNVKDLRIDWHNDDLLITRTGVPV
jgi:hypothetical protein